MQDVLSGKYLNGNPHLEAMIQATRGGVTDQVNSQFSLSGRYGSNAHGNGLGSALGNMEAGLRYQNYGDEMNRMGQAAQMGDPAAVEILSQSGRLIGQVAATLANMLNPELIVLAGSVALLLVLVVNVTAALGAFLFGGGGVFPHYLGGGGGDLNRGG